MSSMLYFSAVGGAHSRHLFPAIKRAFEPASDFKLVVYDKGDTSAFGGAEIIQEPGFKWPLARKYLHPDRIRQYKYIAVWDDDIGCGDFDVVRFCALMKRNRLAMAQPSLRSQHWISHPVVRQHSESVGRFTNFVEIMVPVFTRESWRRFYPFLTDDNTSGWGYDYLPIEPRGVIDCMHVVHTRPVTSGTPATLAQLKSLHARHGLKQYAISSAGELQDVSRRRVMR